MNKLHDIVGARIVEARSRERRRKNACDGFTAYDVPSLKRVYNCDDIEHAKAFAIELIELRHRTRHNMKIVVDVHRVILETWTPHQGVTELDEECIAEADAIFEDTKYYARR